MAHLPHFRFPEECLTCVIIFNLLTALWNELVLHFLDEETDARGENTIHNVGQLVHKRNPDLSSGSKDLLSFYNINSLRQKTLRILNAIECQFL